jgi:serine/threonine protein kinase
MSGLFPDGKKLTINNTGAHCLVEGLLGAGGQGEVYKVSLDGASRALKWYYQQTSTPEQLETLAALVEAGAPDSRFLWPEDLLRDESKTTFGYLMPLRPARFKSISDILTRSVSSTLTSLVTSCANLPDAFLQLHAKGWCYRDISLGNMFFDPKNGDILICDNDNVGVNGSPTTILGTPRFMAPEVVRREAYPSTATDLFSLAVMLFIVLMNNHPLDGRKEYAIHCFDLHAMEQLYGTDPLFIFDPNDKSNAPVPGYHDNALTFWGIYPSFIKELFTESFTRGLRDSANGRVRETDWRTQMCRLRDAIFRCSCSAENFFDIDRMQREGGMTASCWSCKAPLKLPARMRIGSTIVMLDPGSQLFAHHLDKDRPINFNKPLAEVAGHPADARLLGLKNLTGESWSATVDGTVHEVQPGRSMAVSNGTRIHFGKVDGEIRV